MQKGELMANRVVIAHNYGYANESVAPFEPPEPLEPDKSKSISQMSRKELWEMLSRLRDETEIQRVIRELKRSSGERDTYEKPFEIDTKTPINQMYHSGVKGQKWGVRRFQNTDGTRTSAGKKRDLNRHGETKEKPKSEDHVKSRQAKAKGSDGLSNDELKKLNERLQLEENYKKLTAEKMTKADSWVKQSVQSAGQQALTEFTKGVFLGGAKLLIKEISPQFAEVAFNLKEKK